jgi:polysaccharide biosynthesis protein PelC
MTPKQRSKMKHPAAALAVALAACASTGPRYLDRQMDFGSVRTVAVLPFQNLTRETPAGDRVRDVFSTMLLATNAIYVVPLGEVQRVLAKAEIGNPSAPNLEQVVKLGQQLKVDAVITGAVKEYGEVRSGNATSNVVSVSVQMQETSSGKVVWAASSTKGGVTLGDRLLGSSGTPMNQVTEAAVDDLLNKLFK